jgi:3-hydroxyisobutyrate dehydrogenase
MLVINSQDTVIGFVGIGVMGKSMATHLMAAGYRVNVYNRTKSKADELLSDGAEWQESPGGLAAVSDVIITMIGTPQDVREVYLGTDGILKRTKKGSLVIDMTTSSPQLAAEIYQEAHSAGIFALDAPVSGGDIGAKNGTLSIMVGGDQQTFDIALPLFELMGKNIVFQGEAGSGQHCKMANQIAVASTIMGVCEALQYSRKAGLSPETVLASIEAGAAGSWTLSNLGPRMIKGEFGPGFYVKHFIKDMNIALESSNDIGLDAKGLSLVKKLYDQLAADGGEYEGTHALYKQYE